MANRVMIRVTQKQKKSLCCSNNLRQGSKEKRQWPINLCRYIPSNDTKYYPFCRLQFVIETVGHSTK